MSNMKKKDRVYWILSVEHCNCCNKTRPYKIIQSEKICEICKKQIL